MNIKQLFEEKLEDLVNVQKMGDADGVKEILKSVRLNPGSGLHRKEIMYVKKLGDNSFGVITHDEGKPFYIKHFKLIDGKLKHESTVKGQFQSLADAKTQLNKG